MVKKLVVGGIFTVGLLIFGFVVLIKSCLSKYDERSVISRPLIMSKDTMSVVLSIVKFDKTNSYSRQGGFVRKSVTTTYYLQTNDALSGEKIRSIRLKKHKQIKSYPVEMLGSTEYTAWLFAGELMAFDPFSLEKIADTKIIEEKNPSLKGKLSTERRFYELDENEEAIYFTAMDGSRYSLDSKTLIATQTTNRQNEKPGEARFKEIQKLQAQLSKRYDSNYQRYRNANQLYSQQKISRAAYEDSSNRFEKERDLISKLRDSLRQIGQDQAEELNAKLQEERMTKTFSGSVSYSQMKVNTDTFLGRWYGLLQEEALADIPENFDYRRTYNEVSGTCQLYTASLTEKEPGKKYGRWIVGEEKKLLTNVDFLKGGFLLDYHSGKPIHVPGHNYFVIVSKDNIQDDSQVWIICIGPDGDRNKAFNRSTELKEFSYWKLDPNTGRLYIFGTNNKELSSGQINLMHILDFNTGIMISYDFFKQKRVGKKMG